MASPVALAAPFLAYGAADYAVWHALEAGRKGTVSVLALTSLLVTVLRYRPVSGKNSTLAGQIEIYYPRFVAPFALV